MSVKETNIVSENSSPELLSVGIDVAMETLMVCEYYGAGQHRIKEIRNSETSLKRLADKWIGLKYEGKIIMESTGRHHLLAALILSERNLDVRVINPLLAKKYATASIRKVKTDKRDSEILAEIGYKEDKLPNRFKTDKKVLAMRKKMRLAYSLTKQLQNLTSMIKEHEKTLNGLNITMSLCEKEIFISIAMLKKQKTKLENELECEIQSLENNQEKMERYNSIPGVSPYVAALTSLIFSDEYTHTAKQWIAYIGLDISVRQSARWTGKGKLTKRGNDYMRTRLYSAAWGAVRHNPKFKEFYDYLRKDKFRKHREALIIIARKIIRIMFNLNKNKCSFNETLSLFTTA